MKHHHQMDENGGDEWRTEGGYPCRVANYFV